MKTLPSTLTKRSYSLKRSGRGNLFNAKEGPGPGGYFESRKIYPRR